MSKNTSEEIRLGGLLVRFLLEGQDSNGSAAMFEFEVAPSEKVPAAHSHDAYEETIYGLEGVMTLTVNGVQSEITHGQALCIPRGVVHRFDNFHPSTAKALAVITPGILGPAYFREIGDVLKASAGGPPNHAAIGEVIGRNGLTPAPQPSSCSSQPFLQGNSESPMLTI